MRGGCEVMVDNKKDHLSDQAERTQVTTQQQAATGSSQQDDADDALQAFISARDGDPNKC